MQDQCTYDYAVVRIVPHVDRDEFINAGVIVSCHAHAYLAAAIELNEARLTALHPDLDMEAVRAHLRIIPAICAGGPGAGPIGMLPRAERFDWLTAPRSTIIQTSPVHTGTCLDPATALEHLLDTMVRIRGKRSQKSEVRR